MDRCLCGHAKAVASKRKSRPRTQKLHLLTWRDLEQDIYLQPKTLSPDLVFLIHGVDIQEHKDKQSRNCLREVVLIGNVNIPHTVFKAILMLVDFTG